MTAETALNVWTNPAGIRFPLRKSPVRIAIGNPIGASTNSWKIWVHRNAAYVACRDNFREIKVSLHASDIWRVGITDSFAKAHPEFVPAGRDRAWKKWRPVLDETHRLVIGFQLRCLAASFYLHPEDRQTWPSTIIFAEAPNTDTEMAVLSVCVVLGHEPVTSDGKTRGGVLAVIPFGTNRTLQVIVTHESVGNMPTVFIDGFRKMLAQVGDPPTIPDQGVILLHGESGENVPWIGTVPYKIDRVKGPGPSSGSP